MYQLRELIRIDVWPNFKLLSKTFSSYLVANDSARTNRFYFPSVNTRKRTVRVCLLVFAYELDTPQARIN